MDALSFAFVSVRKSFLVEGQLGAVTVGSDSDLNDGVVVPVVGSPGKADAVLGVEAADFANRPIRRLVSLAFGAVDGDLVAEPD